MKILIVGGCGYVGGYMTDFLSAVGHDITVYDNLMYETRFLKKVKFIRGDIRNFDKLNKIIHDYEVVIWLAAIVGDGACAINPNLTELINYECLKWLVDNYHGKIIFPSTCSVYGINHALIDEEAAPNPISKYAETKLKAEQYIVNNHNDYLIFRLGTLFGMGDEFSRLRLDLVVNILTLKAVNKHDLIVSGGEQWRPLLHVKDVSTAVEYGLNRKITGLYNLAYKNYTIKELAEEIHSTIPGANLIYKDIKFEDLRNYRVKTDKMDATGWRPWYTLYQGIREIEKVMVENRLVNPNDSVYSNVNYLKEKPNGDF
jgi:nucleoside-diphosphate-sugar epimerase